ncbi:hypothetical protein GWI33_013389 [Rhynchophorus ferrugineus]|uniref:Uncharacterized protein n=1 Tax=Rhynchophorus ferrugineus TaxID=354439 RepID=A0A834M7X0_RHYFE|nr:hypothetical protein GWI33_013389 [Rhynchophorus ferrugineus]
MNECDLQLARAMVAENCLKNSRSSSPDGSPLPLKKNPIDKLKLFRRTRSLNAPSPVQHFGPCGRIMKNSAMVM